MDETFIAADPARIAAAVHRPECWQAWWPDLRLAVTEDRGAAGVRWSVSGPLEGTTEVWIEPRADGAVVHYYLRADRTGRGSARLRRERRVRGRAGRRAMWALKDDLERGRPVGEPPSG